MQEISHMLLYILTRLHEDLTIRKSRAKLSETATEFTPVSTRWCSRAMDAEMLLFDTYEKLTA